MCIIEKKNREYSPNIALQQVYHLFQSHPPSSPMYPLFLAQYLIQYMQRGIIQQLC